MYNRILTPLDGSTLAEQVLPYVKMLAKPNSVPITLLRVNVPVPPDLIAISQDISTEQVSANIRADAEEYLEKMAAPLREQGMSVTQQVVEGIPAACIVDEGDREPGTLIAMSTHGRSGVARWALGSVTDKVLHATDCPLLIIRSGEEAPLETEAITLKSLIVPLDGSELAEQVLPHAVALAKSHDLNVILVRVTPLAGDYYRYMDYPLPEFDNLPEQMDAEAVEYLQSQSQKLRSQGVPKVEERLIHGPPAIAVADFAKEAPSSLVAMTTHGRSGLERWVLGSVADRVVRHSGGPVLVIRATQQD
jgi:nucleotide-binding universal stress UspA family protein